MADRRHIYIVFGDNLAGLSIVRFSRNAKLVVLYTVSPQKTCDYIFTARCTLVQSAVLRSHVVCLSVCLSVTLVNCDHIG